MRYLREALRRLSPDIAVVRTSPVYETVPVDFIDQADFLNVALEAVTLFGLACEQMIQM